MGAFSTIKPTSPEPKTYAGFPDDQDDWSCAEWKLYYTRNKKLLGKDQAFEIVGLDFGRVGMFANATWCKYQCDWVKFFKKEGFTDQGILSTVFCGITNIGTDVVEVVENTSGGAKFLSKAIVPLAVLGVGAFAYFKRKEIKRWSKKTF